MDCNQRIALLLFTALMLCAAESDSVLAQDLLNSAKPVANAPQSVPDRSSQRPGARQSPGEGVPRDASQVIDRQLPSNFSAAIAPDQEADAANSRDIPVPLRPRSGAASENADGSDAGKSGGSSAGAVLAALVVGLLFLLGLAKLFLKRSPYAISGLPREAIDVLGRRVVDPRNSVYIVKVGNRMIVLGSSPGGLTSLADITDPIEVASLANICAAAQQSRPDAAKWLSKLWPGPTTAVESRPFDDQLGEKLFEAAQQGESVRVDSLTVATGQERHRAG